VKVLVAMSGGVDSSVAAALLTEGGHEVVGATLKLWGGKSDSGCCSVADVEDARRVADQLGIAHHVFNFTDAFEEAVVGPYVQHHFAGRTPNPCIECNRHVKFGHLLERARRLGFGRLATGHHARVLQGPSGYRLLRGADSAKDQSYVLSMLGRDHLEHLVFPVGAMTKAEVRERAARLGLRTAGKPDSQDVCFIHSQHGREEFLASRADLHEGQMVDARTSKVVGTVPAVELVTLGQRRGLGVAGDGRRRYAISVDVSARRVVVGGADVAVATRIGLEAPTWVDRPLRDGARALAQMSAHGRPAWCTWWGDSLRFDEPQRLVAPGQTIALYDAWYPDAVVGAAVAA
jgi:tRNA-specific 2-thiouridylase